MRSVCLVGRSFAAGSCTAGTASCLTFDANNHENDGLVTYDAAGNITSDNMHFYSYDAENRLINVDSGGTASYIYDANGRRVRKTDAGINYDYLYDLGGHVITVYTGGWARGEVYIANRHLATYTNGTTYFAHSDWLGTERARTTVTGAVYETCTSLPFGDNLQCSTTDPSPLHFTGKERDADAYVGNNPLSRVDPDGHACTAWYGNSGWTGSSGFCDRAAEYRKFDENPAINSRTRFFGAAAIVSNSLGDVDAWRVIVRPLGVSSATGSLLEGIGRTLQAFNEGESHLVASGALGSGPALDRQLVHNEQSVVQGVLDGLKGSDTKGYDKAIGEINGSLNGLATRALEEIAPSDRAYAGILAGVRKDLGRDINFANQSDREAIGNAQTQALRNQQH